MVAADMRRNAEGALGQAEIENLCLIALSDENVGGLDVAVNDAFGVSGIEGIGDLDGEVEQTIELHGLAVDCALEGLAFEQLHGDEVTAASSPTS